MSESKKMRYTQSLSQDKAYPIVLKFAKSFFKSSEDWAVNFSPKRGFVLFSPSNSNQQEKITRADFDRLLDLFENPPFNASLRRAWDRQDMEAFEELVRDAVNQKFPPFEEL